MKILFFSYTFAPNIGGIESVSAILAEKFAGAGHEVALVTETEENAQLRRLATGRVRPTGGLSRAGSPTPNVQRPIYAVTRKPSFSQLLSLLGRCELVFQNNISLRSLIPALLMQKRVIVVHQTWLRNVDDGIGWNNRVKRALLRFVTNVAISQAMRDHINVPARIINNPYDDAVFRLHPEIARDKEFVFVGRLVCDKGVDVLLRALVILRTSEANTERPTPNAQRPMAEEERIEHHNRLQADLTIIGVGPEEGKLRELTHELGLDRQVTFAGEKSGDELAEVLNRHKIMVVPSRWAEPFGIVALEGIACGCVVVGSRDGGLREAIGPCGLTFKNGDERDLADCLKVLLLDPTRKSAFQSEAPVHLAKFRAGGVANAYLQLIKEISH